MTKRIIWFFYSHVCGKKKTTFIFTSCFALGASLFFVTMKTKKVAVALMFLMRVSLVLYTLGEKKKQLENRARLRVYTCLTFCMCVFFLLAYRKKGELLCVRFSKGACTSPYTTVHY